MKSKRFKFTLKRTKFDRFKIIFVVIYLLATSTHSSSQTVDNLTIEKVPEDGLSNNSIICINQDTNGFLWFGTLEGLFRYDGYSYKAFRNFPGDSSTLVNNGIQCLYPDKEKVWIGTFGGLSCIDINSQRIRNFPGKELLQVFAIVPKDDSVLWVGTSAGLFQFSKKNSQWKRIGALGKNIFITSICDDKKGHLYITIKNGFYCYNAHTGSFEYYQPDLPIYANNNKRSPVSFTRSLLGSDGKIWMSTWGAGLVRFDPKSKTIKSWYTTTPKTNKAPYYIALNLLEDDGRNIWIANQAGGLTVFNFSKNNFTNYPIDWKSENNLSRAVMALFRDMSGIVWIGTSAGIFKCDPHSIYLSKTEVRLKTATGAANAMLSPLALLKGKDGTWWYGTYSGLYTLDLRSGLLTNRNSEFGIPKSWPVFSIIQDKSGAIWLNAKNTLLKIYKKAGIENHSFLFKTYKSPAIQSNLYALYIDKESRIWIGTYDEGIFRFDERTGKFISYDYGITGTNGKIKEIRTFCELSKDSLLIGGEQTGLFLLHIQEDRYENVVWKNMARFAVEPSINTIYKNGSDVLVGTEFDGLWRTDTRLTNAVIKTINDGLPAMNITAIVADKKNNLWLLTNAGAAEFNNATEKITIFDKKDGISDFTELSSIVADVGGNIIFGGVGCIYNFNPSVRAKNTRAPEVFITNLKVFDKDYPLRAGQKITLNYNQNYFSFEYVALNYTHPKLNKYAYKMDGLDKKWNDAGSRRYVSYANLDEGTYVFNVKACNNEGIWNNVPARLVIVITPPLWHRWWFYLTVVLVFAAIIYTLYMYNINQLKIRLQMRDKIARDLHDDIGSTLSGINIFSKIAMQKMSADQPGGLELVAKISERSQNTLEALSDIVWSINTRNDGMDNFLMKANEYLSILEVQGIGYDFKVDPELEHMKLGMILRRELYLIFKEAICNAAKYARCTFIQIYLARNKDHCTLTIHDNGKGFNPDTVGSGNGIYNMRQRAQKMNGELTVASRENEGTLVTLNFRITHFR